MLIYKRNTSPSNGSEYIQLLEQIDPKVIGELYKEGEITETVKIIGNIVLYYLYQIYILCISTDLPDSNKVNDSLSDFEDKLELLKKYYKEDIEDEKIEKIKTCYNLGSLKFSIF